MPFILPFAEKPHFDFTAVQVGDSVTRMLGGLIPMELNVSEVSEKLIHCGGWTFDRKTGAEVDEDLSISASHLVKFTPAAERTNS